MSGMGQALGELVLEEMEKEAELKTSQPQQPPPSSSSSIDDKTIATTDDAQQPRPDLRAVLGDIPGSVTKAALDVAQQTYDTVYVALLEEQLEDARKQAGRYAADAAMTDALRTALAAAHDTNARLQSQLVSAHAKLMSLGAGWKVDGATAKRVESTAATATRPLQEQLSPILV